MRVFIETLPGSRGITRITDNLIAHLPDSVSLVDAEEAEMIVLPIIGRRDHRKAAIARLLERGQAYAMIQIALGSTRNPKPEDWLPLWKGAKLVWSYYNLPQGFNFYHAPLGADPKIFYSLKRWRDRIICLTGMDSKRECLLECALAADQVEKKYIHIWGASDAEVNEAYNRSYYVNALRRADGFEMPAAEGLLCGTRPILFDTPDYRQWFDGLAEFIPENASGEVTESLVRIFRGGYRAVTEPEIEEARRRFDWAKITAGFWERVM